MCVVWIVSTVDIRLLYDVVWSIQGHYTNVQPKKTIYMYMKEHSCMEFTYQPRVGWTYNYHDDDIVVHVLPQTCDHCPNQSLMWHLKKNIFLISDDNCWHHHSKSTKQVARMMGIFATTILYNGWLPLACIDLCAQWATVTCNMTKHIIILDLWKVTTMNTEYLISWMCGQLSTTEAEPSL